MLSSWRENKILVRLTQGAGGLTGLLGVAVLIGFALKIPLLMQISSAWEEMKPSSALRFCATGISLFLLARWPQQARWASFATACLAMVLFLYANTRLNSILCFLSSSICIFLLTYNAGRYMKGRVISGTFIAGAIMVGGLISLIGYASGYNDIFPLNHTGRMAMHSAVTFVIVGALLAGLAITDSRRELLWLPLPVFFVMLMLVLPVMNEDPYSRIHVNFRPRIINET